ALRVDDVEGCIAEGKALRGVGQHQRDPDRPEMAAGHLELGLAEVGADEARVEPLSDLLEEPPVAAAHLEDALRADRLEPRREAHAPAVRRSRPSAPPPRPRHSAARLMLTVARSPSRSRRTTPAASPPASTM